MSGAGRRAGGRNGGWGEGQREGGEVRQRRAERSEVAGDAARSPAPTPRFCSLEVRCSRGPGARAAGWGPGRSAEAQDPMPSPRA